MGVEVRVPAAGESISEVQVARWLKAPGEAVAVDENLVVIETDKATLEVPAPVAGVLAEIRKKEGETVAVGDVLAVVEEGASAPAVQKEAAPSQKSPTAKAEPPHIAVPSARRALAEHGLTAEQVTPSGAHGRITKEDVLRHVATKRPDEAPPPKPGEEVVPMSLLRRRIAERLVEAQQNAALVTTFNEIDMGAVQELRRRHQEAFQRKYQVKLGLMSFFVKACVDALGQVPQLNAEIRGTDIIYRNYYDIGVAVGGGRGLVVPVLRGVERMSFAQVELAIADFGKRALSNHIRPDELAGGTFTISNGGIYGSLLSTPIVNPPQSGILGLHAIQDRAVARDGQVVIRPMMYVALTYDHRLVDGREAVTFLVRIKACLEEPSRMLLEV